MNQSVFYVLIILILIILCTSIWWVYGSYDTFPNRLTPGQEYTVGGRNYKVPNLPSTVYQTNLKPSINRSIPMLSRKSLIDLRKLIIDTFATLDDMDVKWWVTGGSLISAVLWKHLMPFDDDADVSILFREKDKLWQPKFFEKLNERGLECFILRGVKRSTALTHEGAALRTRRKGTTFPVVDIFFLDWDEKQERWAHVMSWINDKPKFDTKNEVWKEDWLFPLQRVVIDDMEWNIPAKPELMLDKHYGPEWKTVIKSPQPLIRSHTWVFKFTNLVSAWKVLTPEDPGFK
jgi:hypothetical protein